MDLEFIWNYEYGGWIYVAFAAISTRYLERWLATNVNARKKLVYRPRERICDNLSIIAKIRRPASSIRFDSASTLPFFFVLFIMPAVLYTIDTQVRGS